MSTRSSAILTVLIVIAGCSSGETSVELVVVNPGALEMNGLAVWTPDGERRTVEMAPVVTLLVPERWAGTEQRFAVDGTFEGVVVGSGAVSVTPVSGREVIAEVTLLPASCDLICDIDAVQCRDEATVACVIGTDGCPAWSDPEACPSDRPFCSSGVCAADCSDECSANATMCTGDLVRTCGQHDADSCLDWSVPDDCPGDQICNANACTASATLTVTTIGDGSVSSSPTGIACGADCSETYAAGTMVELTATPGAGATFASWSGGGCGVTTPCTVTLAAATTITATFAMACPETCSPVQVATGGSPYRVAFDNTYVYWTELLGDSLKRRRRDLSSASETVATLQDGPTGIVTDATHVYWVTLNADTVMRRRKDLSSAAELIASNQNGAWDVIVDDNYVYWSTYTGTGLGVISRRRKDLLAGVEDLEVVEAATLALGGAYLYWTNALADTIRRRRTDLSAAAETFAANQDSPIGIAVDGAQVYWRNVSEIVRRRADMSTNPEPVASTVADTSPIVRDGYLYWATSAGEVMRRATSLASSIETLATGQINIKDVRVDATHVYWTTDSVMRLSRCACSL